jgi:hypothetical protein
VFLSLNQSYLPADRLLMAPIGENIQVSKRYWRAGMVTITRELCTHLVEMERNFSQGCFLTNIPLLSLFALASTINNMIEHTKYDSQVTITVQDLNRRRADCHSMVNSHLTIDRAIPNSIIKHLTFDRRVLCPYPEAPTLRMFKTPLASTSAPSDTLFHRPSADVIDPSSSTSAAARPACRSHCTHPAPRPTPIVSRACRIPSGTPSSYPDST